MSVGTVRSITHFLLVFLLRVATQVLPGKVNLSDNVCIPSKKLTFCV